MLVITDLRARLRSDENQLINLMQEIEHLQDAEWDDQQRGDLYSIGNHLMLAKSVLSMLITTVPAYHSPTEHHEDEV